MFMFDIHIVCALRLVILYMTSESHVMSSTEAASDN